MEKPLPYQPQLLVCPVESWTLTLLDQFSKWLKMFRKSPPLPLQERLSIKSKPFRVGKIKKSQAIFQIGQILAAEPTGDDELKSNSLDRYAATLDGIEALAAELSRHGNQITDKHHGKQKSGSNRRSHGHEEPHRNHANNS